ncbi:MAG TPA: FGGY family carbohydrate kinase [Flexivirga sp.]|uniref:FGGY family carbohydrate kinase n=1 Tax=Flexivirga sp. TaxID=1962927 RepID=UPI002C7BB15D|nr:FGGY family carbohydrate kinase [Flexivirga sp.]HWC24658.1 FGGY family carbohydrate kinase [Flexivirga sp.]
MSVKAILAIDEGTTGTRAALVTDAGEVRHLTYRSLAVQHPVAGVVEQDFDEIWTETLDAARAVLAQAAVDGVEVVAAAVAVQRSSAVLWNAKSGKPIGPGMVWQDTRYAEELADLGTAWNQRLRSVTGRVAGVRSPYLWAAHRIREDAEVRAAHQRGELRFGTVDTWLTWKLTGGRRNVTSATNVVACGGYDLAAGTYFKDWIDATGLPAELLPELVDDGGDIACTDPTVLGLQVPLRTVIGDQHAALLGLGCLATREGTCIHGTGSFVDQIVSSDSVIPRTAPDAVVHHVAWKRGDPVLALENYTATTGSALQWACDELDWFSSPQEISALAAKQPLWSRPVPFFAPTLTGVRLPRVETRVQGSLTGLNLATTRVDLAHGMLEGIAQCVARSVDANRSIAGTAPGSVRVGGGLSLCDPLLQLQADLTGLPMLRYRDTEKTTVRGAAFLAGVDVLWASLADAVATLRAPETFEPQIGEDQRCTRIHAWRSVINAELAELDHTEPLSTSER